MIHFLYNYSLTRDRNKKKNKLKRWFNWQVYKYLKINLVNYYENLSASALGTDKNSNVIVSLTTFPARIDFVHLSIRSILHQTKRPKKIVLWLGEEFFPNAENDLPNSLLELRPLGLDIEFCTDIKAHTKYFYAFQKYPENLVVTVDDDIIYPKNLLKVLLNTHQQYPNSVIANRVRKVEIENNTFKPYREWKINPLNIYKPSKKILATGVSGVLYQPQLFSEAIFDVEGIKKINCIGDDIWLKAAQIASNIPVVNTNVFTRAFIEIPNTQEQSLFKTNVFESDNDRQIQEVFNHFKINEKSFE
jgi:hypothetical protein